MVLIQLSIAKEGNMMTFISAPLRSPSQRSPLTSWDRGTRSRRTCQGRFSCGSCSQEARLGVVLCSGSRAANEVLI